MIKSVTLFLLMSLFAVITVAQEGFNYDESKVGTYVLPEILKMADGKTVSSVAEWEKLRRPEILKLFEDHVYGQVPKDYDDIKFEVRNQDPNAMGGKATLKEVAITVSRKGKSVAINLVMFTPNQVKKPVPVFVVINHRGMKTMDVTRQNKDGFWPAEEVVEAGYGIAGFDVIDFAPDHKVNYTKGVLDQLYPEQVKMDNGMAALGAWGWGASRVIDYFEKDQSVDAAKVMTVGHSRGGKASLWCGAQDRRVAITFSNESGNSGAALSRRNFGETVARITASFPYWFCPNYRQYANNEDKLPVDQHMLMALMAPRPVYVASAAEDLWADPKGQYMALAEAQSIYKLYGFPTNLPAEMPAVDKQVISLPLGFHNRAGKHNMTPFDWQQFITFANSHFKQAERAALVKPDPAVVLSYLDLNRRGLEKVKASAGKPDQARKALLDYYRSREGVKHFTDRGDKASAKGNGAGSGDIEMAENAMKHIFVGQSAYPPYFCGDDINWGTRPVPDNEWVWQLNRMSFWDAMGRAYWHTGDEKYAKEWAFQLADWVKKNPNDKEHAHAWRSIEAGIRGNKIPGWFQRFVDSPAFTPELLTAFLTTCHDHSSYLMKKYTTKSNWGLMEAEGMAAIAIFFPEFKEAETWKTEAIRRLNNEINIQVYPDGHQRELAMGYHMGCINWFKRTYELAKLNGITDAFPPSYLQTIEKMCEVPMKLCFPDGTTAQFGDAWAGNPGQYNNSFREWANFYNRKDFLYLATDGKEGTPPAQTAYALPQSGLYSMRSSWNKDAICLVLKCGPDGGGHSQPDNGTFSLYAGGRTLMPDAGSYIYSGDPENRAWFRQSMVHQTLTLDNKNSKYAPKLLLWKPGENLDVLVVENQSYENLAHRRAVFFVDKKYFILYDEAIGPGTGEIGLHFQLAPGKGLFNAKDFLVRSGYVEGWNLLVKTNPQDGLRLEEEEGQVSYKYTIKEPRPAFAYKIKKNEPGQTVRYVTLVLPFEGKLPDVKVELIGTPQQGSNAVRLKVTENGRSKEIGYTL